MSGLNAKVPAKLWLVILLISLLSAVQAWSAPMHHPSWTVAAKCGTKTVWVAPSAKGNVEALCADLVSRGVPIVLAGGWRPGHCSGRHRHSCATAVDINQTGRNKVVRRFPANITAIARRHGFVSGGIWCHADLGHFEIYDGTNAMRCRRSLMARRHRHHRHHRHRVKQMSSTNLDSLY